MFESLKILAAMCQERKLRSAFQAASILECTPSRVRIDTEDLKSRQMVVINDWIRACGIKSMSFVSPQQGADPMNTILVIEGAEAKKAYNSMVDCGFFPAPRQ